jgi:DNA-cytosine methyltransferase
MLKITMKHLDLFSGIGGFAVAAEAVWGKNITHIFCENESFCEKILKKHWPEATIYGDIRTLTADAEHQRQLQPKGRKQKVGQRAGDIYLLTGGFPCQPFSQAGVRRGTNDDRHLWPEMCRVIREFKPRWVIAENVAGLLSIDGGVVFESVCTDLEREGYAVQAFIIPAVAVGAPHRRDRVWIVARNAKHDGFNGTRGERRGTEYQGNEAQRREELSGRDAWREAWPEVAQRLCGAPHGVPCRLDGFGRVVTKALMGYTLLIRDYFYGTEKKNNTEEILSVMQETDVKKRISKLVGRYDSLQEPKILRCEMHGESNDERESNERAVSTKSQRIQRREVREMWHEQATACSSYKRGLERQCSCKFDDVVRELSSPFALADWEENAEETVDFLYRVWQKSGRSGLLHEPLQALQEVWQSVTDKEVGSFRRHYYLRDNNRNAALKGAGNAIVPQVAAQIMRAIKAIDDKNI